jgi:hypothetical protein
MSLQGNLSIDVRELAGPRCLGTADSARQGPWHRNKPIPGYGERCRVQRLVSSSAFGFQAVGYFSQHICDPVISLSNRHQIFISNR